MYTVYLDKQLIHDLDSEDNVLVNPTLNLELNKAATFEFSMQPTHPCYAEDDGGKMTPFHSALYPIQVLHDGEEIFKGRVVSVETDLYKQKTFYCEGELAYLNDSLQRPYEFQLASEATWRYLDYILKEHNSRVSYDELQFEEGQVSIDDPNDYIYCYTNYDTTMESIKGDLVDDYGGYIRVRNEYRNNDPLGTLTGRYIDYITLNEYGSRSTQVIEFGENLLDFTKNNDKTDLFTVLIPLGATLEESEYDALETRLTIESVNGGSDCIILTEAANKYGYIERTVTWDDITDANNLYRTAENYLANYDFENIVIEAKAVDMHLTDEQVEQFRLGDMIHVISKPHDLDEWFPLSQMSIPLDDPSQTTITLGTFEDTSLSARNNAVSAGLADFRDFSVGSVISSAVARATKLIDQHTNGYVTIHYDEDRDCADEILIMDAPNTDDARRVWRWNLNGLGYSSTGYSEEQGAQYGLAMTMDGRILGTFITATGMVLANDSQSNYGKFDGSGMKIYCQAGREDLLLMSVGTLGMTLYNDEGNGVLATFDSEAVTFYSDSTMRTQREEGQGSLIAAGGSATYAFKRVAVSVFDVGLDEDTIERRGYPIPEEDVDFTMDYGIDWQGYSYVHVVNLTDHEIYVAVKCSTAYYEQTDLYKNMQLDGNGLRVYDHNGNLRSNMDSDSFDVYDSNEKMSMTINSGGMVIWDSDGNKKMDLSTYGIEYYRDGDMIGVMETNGLVDHMDSRGLAFNLEPEAAFATFAWQETTSATYYTMMLSLYTDNNPLGPKGIHFGANAFLNNFNLYLCGEEKSAYLQSANDGTGILYHGDAYFVDGSMYYNGAEVATKNDINSLSTYSTTDLQDKIDALEARIARLEELLNER